MGSGAPGTPDGHRRQLRLGPVEPTQTSSTQERLRRECAEMLGTSAEIRFLFSGTVMKHWWLFFVTFAVVYIIVLVTGLPSWVGATVGVGAGSIVMISVWDRWIVAVSDHEILLFESGAWRLSPRRLLDRLPLVALSRIRGLLGWRVRLHGEELSIGRGAEEAQVAAAVAAVDEAIHRHDAA